MTLRHEWSEGMLDLDGLRALCAICDTGGFTNAGDALHLTQSTISHQVRRLEQRLGRRLLKRTTRAVQPTADGEMLLADGRRILELVAEAEARFAREPSRGEIRLGVPEEIASGPLGSALARFRMLQPGIRVAVTVGLSKTMRSAVDHRKIDLAILKEVPATRGAISPYPLSWAGTKRVAQQNTVPLAFFPEPCEYRRRVLRLLDKAKRRYEVVMTSTSSESLRAVAREEVALVVLSRAQCPPEIRLDHASVGLPDLPSSGYRLYPHAPASEAIAGLKDLIRRYL
jgi:DNA-binding transcriptional LysR family regulator